MKLNQAQQVEIINAFASLNDEVGKAFDRAIQSTSNQKEIGRLNAQKNLAAVSLHLLMKNIPLLDDAQSAKNIIHMIRNQVVGFVNDLPPQIKNDVQIKISGFNNKINAVESEVNTSGLKVQSNENPAVKNLEKQLTEMTGSKHSSVNDANSPESTTRAITPDKLK